MFVAKGDKAGPARLPLYAPLWRCLMQIGLNASIAGGRQVEQVPCDVRNARRSAKQLQRGRLLLGIVRARSSAPLVSTGRTGILASVLRSSPQVRGRHRHARCRAAG